MHYPNFEARLVPDYSVVRLNKRLYVLQPAKGDNSHFTLLSPPKEGEANIVSMLTIKGNTKVDVVMTPQKLSLEYIQKAQGVTRYSIHKEINNGETKSEEDALVEAGRGQGASVPIALLPAEGGKAAT